MRTLKSDAPKTQPKDSTLRGHATKKPRGRPKGKLEGRSSDIGLQTPTQISAKRLSTGSIGASGKENHQENDAISSDSKRKRHGSATVFLVGLDESKKRSPDEGVCFVHDDLPEDGLPSRKVSKHEISSPKKPELEDDLTPEGVVTRPRKDFNEFDDMV